MIKNSKNQNETDVIFEGLRTLEAILSTTKNAVKAIKQYRNKNLRLSIKDYNNLKRDLCGMTEVHNKMCDDLINLAEFLLLISEISEENLITTLTMVDSNRKTYLAFKRSQPDYIKKLMA